MKKINITKKTQLAEMVLVDVNKIPKTHEGLKQWIIDKSKEKDYLVYTDVAKDVQDIIAGGLFQPILNRFGRLLHLLHSTPFQLNLKIFMGYTSNLNSIF